MAVLLRRDACIEKIVPVSSIYDLCSPVPIWSARLLGVKDYSFDKVSWCHSGVILIFTVRPTSVAEQHSEFVEERTISSSKT